MLFIFFMELVVGFFLKWYKADIFVSPDGFLSMISGCAQVPVIHDLNFIHYPKDLKLKNRVYYNIFFKRFAKKAKRIATVSEFSKMDIVEQYKIPAEKIDKVFNGINNVFHVLTDAEKKCSLSKI